MRDAWPGCKAVSYALWFQGAPLTFVITEIETIVAFFPGMHKKKCLEEEEWLFLTHKDAIWTRIAAFANPFPLTFHLYSFLYRSNFSL